MGAIALQLVSNPSNSVVVDGLSCYVWVLSVTVLGHGRGRQCTFERFLRHSVHAFCVTWPARRLGPVDAGACLGASDMAPILASIRIVVMFLWLLMVGYFGGFNHQA